jgi:hypothetical protein
LFQGYPQERGLATPFPEIALRPGNVMEIPEHDYYHVLSAANGAADFPLMVCSLAGLQA